ncbi:hypothetical protein RchiOBHm_Chr5g0057071 [Rosa chinensis]|uniref:Uncharacterized protein n=1 Tax=Rosa chinensis TaxID=74649 RepID=A0A2P6QGT8_ROSCH|nr:hypothetical protein RchiOBHm_Chr5g0057071 [Rosa chinensis]
MSKAPETHYHYCGVIERVPSSSSKRSSQFSESTQVEKKVRASYKDEYGGGWSKFTESYKAQEYVDKKTGGMGYKQEAKYTSTDKYVDNEQGYTTEYHTQVKIQKSVYPNKSSTSKSKNNKDSIGYY